MKLLQSLSIIFACITALPAYSQKSIKLSSPDGNIQYVFQLKDKAPVYTVSFKGKPIIKNSGLILSFSETGLFKHDLKILKPVFREAIETYELIVGKAKSVNHPFKEVIIPLEETKKPFRKINLVVRAFNDGLAFRNEFPRQKNWSSYSLTDENSDFKLTGDPKLLNLFLPNYTTSSAMAGVLFPLAAGH